MLFTNTNDDNNVTVTDKGGVVRVLKPGEKCEVMDHASAAIAGLEASRAKAAENAAKKAAAKKEESR